MQGRSGALGHVSPAPAQGGWRTYGPHSRGPGQRPVLPCLVFVFSMTLLSYIGTKCQAQNALQTKHVSAGVPVSCMLVGTVGNAGQLLFLLGTELTETQRKNWQWGICKFLSFFFFFFQFNSTVYVGMYLQSRVLFSTLPTLLYSVHIEYVYDAIIPRQGCV